jgi:hypothetical protein
MTRRGDRVPRPPGPGEWDVFAADNDAGRGWDELCRSHPAAARAAFDALARAPRLRTRRQHPLQGSLGRRAVGGRRRGPARGAAPGGRTGRISSQSVRRGLQVTSIGPRTPCLPGLPGYDPAIPSRSVGGWPANAH